MEILTIVALIAMGLTGLHMILADRAVRECRELLRQIEERSTKNVHLMRVQIEVLSLIDIGAVAEARELLQEEFARG